MAPYMPFNGALYRQCMPLQCCSNVASMPLQWHFQWLFNGGSSPDFAPRNGVYVGDIARPN
eukprot:49185-Eustigmatos_ZCMA.PRE.1